MEQDVGCLDSSELPQDFIIAVMGTLELHERFNCALVCRAWAEAAAAATRSIVKRCQKDLTNLQQWLKKYGNQLEALELDGCDKAGLTALPCAELNKLLLHGAGDTRFLWLSSRAWRDLAAATKLTSVSLVQLHVVPASQAVSALAALPDLHRLTWG